MKYILQLIILFFCVQVAAEVYLIEDTATIEKIGKIKLTDESEYSIISIIGHWKDNIGSFGSNTCYGKLEKKKDITLLLETVCVKESIQGKIFTKGGRKKSLNKAGVGILEVIDATAKYKALKGKNCTYAVSYFKKSIQYITKCKVSEKTLRTLKNK